MEKDIIMTMETVEVMDAVPILVDITKILEYFTNSTQIYLKKHLYLCRIYFNTYTDKSGTGMT